EELRQGVAVDSRRRHVGADPVGEGQEEGHQDPALELRDLEDVLERLQAFDHEAVTFSLIASTSTRPPCPSTLARAPALMACTRTVRVWAMSPSPRIFTRPRSERLISPACARPSGSTTLPAAKPPSALRFTTAYSVFPPNGRKPRLGMRRESGICPPSNPPPLPPPEGPPCPLAPLRGVFPRPEPGPRPIRLRRCTAPGAGRRSSSFMGHRQDVRRLGDHAADRGGVVVDP